MTCDAQTAGDVAVALDMAALLKLIEIVVDHRGRRDAAALADLANRRRMLVLALVVLNEIQDALVAFAQTLALSDHHHVRLLTNYSLICAMNNTRTCVPCQGSSWQPRKGRNLAPARLQVQASQENWHPPRGHYHPGPAPKRSAQMRPGVNRREFGALRECVDNRPNRQ